MAGRSFPENDGGERLPAKQVGWTGRVPLQVEMNNSIFSGGKLVPFRDDGFQLWDALNRYVEGVVQVAYPSDQVSLLLLRNTTKTYYPTYRILRQMRGWLASMPVLQILAKEIYLASLKHLATGYSSTKCPPTKIIVQESVDRHSDLDNLHWERPTPGPQCSSPSLLLHAPQTHYTHQVR